MADVLGFICLRKHTQNNALGYTESLIKRYVHDGGRYDVNPLPQELVLAILADDTCLSHFTQMYAI